jgi:linoleoyl-CoA desaturase
VVHHSHPNTAGVDEDVDLSPFFALTTLEIESASPFFRPYYSLQIVLLPIAVALATLNMQRQGWAFLVRAIWRGGAHRRKAWTDLACLLGHYALWLGLPATVVPPGRVLMFYLLRLAVLGCAAFALFAPAHFPPEATCTTPADAPKDFVRRQTDATLNFDASAATTAFCSGLEFQIEHHLFPGYDHTVYPKLSRDVRAFCERHGYAYRSQRWSHGLGKSLLIFVRPKRLSGSSASKMFE